MVREQVYINFDSLVVQDSIHGKIDIHDPNLDNTQIIPRLINCPALERLRRIKQLGFASQRYISADHSRYAHAIGTMHIMRKILNRLLSQNGISGEVFTTLKKAFPKYFLEDRATNEQLLVQHMVVAALLQDIGELPYGQASKLVYRPSEELCQEVEHFVNEKINHWSIKNIFTVGCLYKEPLVDILESLCLPFLVFLITGSIKELYIEPLQPLRHMLDGVVDADRLDYVFRDAQHTVGGLGSPYDVVQSLLYYDNIGPVFSDPAPVLSFLVTRAHLYSTVYLSPENRFRTLLLVNFLQGIARNSTSAKDFFGVKGNGELSIDDFLELDDVSLTSKIVDFNSNENKRHLDKKTKKSLEILAGQYHEYEYTWLPPPSIIPNSPSEKFSLPQDLFFDTFSGQEHSLYRPNSVRICAPQFRLFQEQETVGLEKCGGSLNTIFRNNETVLPMPGSILLFTPKKKTGEIWDVFQKQLDESTLYNLLIDLDPLTDNDFPDNTCMMDGFTGIKIFISFAWGDIRIVKRVADFLYKKRRRYFLFRRPFNGIGNTAIYNSVKGVEKADAVLVLSSVNYVNRFKDEPNGYIARELYAMRERINHEGLKIIFLSIDEPRVFREKLPWALLKLDAPPYLGKPLKDLPNQDFEEAMNHFLDQVDSTQQQQ